MDSTAYRRDIDGLRAVAVASVVLFHAFPALLPGGFIGVDVFFVISGYLISSIIFRGMDDGVFSFATFYGRRVKRVFPALFLVLAFTYAVGWFFLLPEDFKRLGQHVAGGAGFASNFVLLGEVGYFDTSASLKPLLHLWSLGIEEQFYFFWPLLAYGAHRTKVRFWVLAALIAIASFGFDVHLTHSDAVSAFYLPHSRAWELLVGALLACVMMRARSFPTILRANALSTVGISLLIIAEFRINGSSRFPGWWALLPTIGAALLISAGPAAWLNKVVLSNRVVVFVGLISFPLYLWHWPLLVFVRLGYAGSVPAPARAGIIVVSLLLSWLTYKFVETPIRHGALVGLKVASLCMLILAIGYAGINTYHREGLEFRTVARANKDLTTALNYDYWKSANCTSHYAVEPCLMDSDHPEVMLLGDSHVNHFYPGLAANPVSPKIINVNTCLPLKGIRLSVAKNQAAYVCTNRDNFSFNARVLEDYPSIKAVVISGWWKENLDGGNPTQAFKDTWGEIEFTSKIPSDAGLDRPELIFRGLSRTISYLEARHLKVVFVPDTPYIEEDMRTYCAIGNPFRAYSDCSMSRSKFEVGLGSENAMVNRLKQAHPDLIVFDARQYFCDSDRCYLSRNHQFLYRNENHLSVYGSALVAQHLAPLLATLVSSKPAKGVSAPLARQ